MLSPPGVLVPLALVEYTGGALLSAVRRGEVPASVEVLRLINEFEIAATATGASVLGNGDWTPPAGWLTVEEVAALLDIKPRAVRARIAAGTLPARKLGGRWWLEPLPENGH